MGDEKREPWFGPGAVVIVAGVAAIAFMAWLLLFLVVLINAGWSVGLALAKLPPESSGVVPLALGVAAFVMSSHRKLAGLQRENDALRSQLLARGSERSGSKEDPPALGRS